MSDVLTGLSISVLVIAAAFVALVIYTSIEGTDDDH